mgnify:CR=1 FL=1
MRPFFSFERKEDPHGTDQRQRHRAAGQNLLAYLTDQEYRTDRIAIELNGAIVSRKDYDKVTLKDGDAMEIVHFVGGADSLLRQSSHELIYHYKRSVSQWKKKDTLVLGGHEFTSRFILGSGKFSVDLIKAAVEQGGARW